MTGPSALDIIAEELERLNGVTESVREHMARANSAQAEAHAMLGRILHKLENYSEDNARTSERLRVLERFMHAQPQAE